MLSFFEAASKLHSSRAPMDCTVPASAVCRYAHPIQRSGYPQASDPPSVDRNNSTHVQRHEENLRWWEDEVSKRLLSKRERPRTTYPNSIFSAPSRWAPSSGKRFTGQVRSSTESRITNDTPLPQHLAGSRHDGPGLVWVAGRGTFGTTRPEEDRQQERHPEAGAPSLAPGTLT